MLQCHGRSPVFYSSAIPTASTTQTNVPPILLDSAADASAADASAVDAVDDNNNIPRSDMVSDARPTANRDVSTAAAAAAAPTTSTTQSDGSSILPDTAASTLAAASDTVLDVDADDNNNNIPSSDMILDEQMTAVKNKFYATLEEKTTKRKVEIPTLDEYNTICRVLDGWNRGDPHTPEQRKWKDNYVLVAGPSPLRRKGEQNLKVATKEEMFAIIMSAHQRLSHAKDPRSIIKFIKKYWYGITEEDVKSAVSLCPQCFASKPKISAKQMPLKMILSETVGKRAQMDLIDMTSQQDPDGFCWILRLIDHHSGFGAVRALKSKTSKECAVAVIQILCSFPDFNILQSDNGGEFLGETVKSVNE
jgi:hypothetical protein